MPRIQGLHFILLISQALAVAACDGEGFFAEPIQPPTCIAGYSCEDSGLDIHDEQTLGEARAALIAHVWKRRGFPVDVYARKVGAATSPIDGLSNLERIDDLAYEMALAPEEGEGSFVYHAHHFVPSQRVGRLVLVHQGHDGTLVNYGLDTALRFFIARGFDVVALRMPLFGDNAGPRSSHGAIMSLESETRCGLQFFMEPVLAALNAVLQEGQYEDVSMIGISGGGWTTDLYSALDVRVGLSFSVAGSLPRDLRTGGDAEERHELLDYRDLYVLGGSEGRRHFQVLNPRDGCCFWGTDYRRYENVVGSAARALGGDFLVYLDVTIPERHRISQAALDTPVALALEGRDLRILDNTSSGFGYPGSAYGETALSGEKWATLAGGFENDRLKAAPEQPGDAEVNWVFRGLRAGRYQVSATWVAGEDRASNAVYRIEDGTSLLGSVSVDQRIDPAGRTELGIAWQVLQSPVTPAGDTLVVRVSNEANGFVIADAVTVERL
ncbi:MAG: hypothetical protein HY791_22915 [Deltaproteobacteria bacterium]|nr:hypothetical protein [Deltaproteobacteria bacterium]